MHVPSGLPYLYDPQSHDGVPIALHLTAAAQWCADNGIPLHDPRNPNTELRDFAIAWRRAHGDKQTAKMETHNAGTVSDVAYVPPWSGPFSVARRRGPRDEYNAAKKARIKKRRKLQKKRGVR